jgi:hypothetical protein
MSAPSLAVREGRLPVARKIGLAFEILRAYVRVRRELRHATLPEALNGLRAPGSGTASPAETARLARAVRRTLRLLPTDTRCLSQSLVLTALLARRNVPSTLVIGVSPGESFGAHAWVEHQGVPLLPPYEAEFQRLTEL